jgi:hypothetical protein
VPRVLPQVFFWIQTAQVRTEFSNDTSNSTSSKNEANIVIISLVAAAKSSIPFVPLRNRMSMPSSRAGIRVFIIGYNRCLESKASDSSHWQTALSPLQKVTTSSGTASANCIPPIPSNTRNDTSRSRSTNTNTNTSTSTNSNIVQETKCLGYAGSRIGDAPPICRPKHRSVSFSLKDCKDFAESICKNPPASTLDCGHPCDLLCHFSEAVNIQHAAETCTFQRLS